jgi:hypothetical protein
MRHVHPSIVHGRLLALARVLLAASIVVLAAPLGLARQGGFPGTGGPGGNFDWEVPAGQIVVFDTTQTTIVGGPHFVQTTQYVVKNGILDLRNLRIAEGAILRIQGPNPFYVLATGRVEVLGTLDASGTSSIGVNTLNTTSLPEPGSPGQAGGGKGGTGSPLTGLSSPRGGNGFGAFAVPDGGGVGGEAGWSNFANVDSRRGGGGGGGRFGADQLQTLGPVGMFGLYDQAFIGLDAENGFANKNAQANGAITGASGPFGGRIGPSPFVDGDPTNDFWGILFDPATGLTQPGELLRPWAGAGGGGGGDASWVPSGSWPPPWNPAGDEKGAGGGGGAGSVTVLSLGTIQVGPSGVLRARGGTGGGGENTIYFDRVGGGSGGGSGGHVILHSARKIDLSMAGGAGGVALLATGGEGGAGKNNIGGAYPGPSGVFEQPPLNDACPPGYPTSGPNACKGHVDGTGGDGGPGIVQLHAPGGPANILLPAGVTLDMLSKPLPVCGSGGCYLLPLTSARSGGDADPIEPPVSELDVVLSTDGALPQDDRAGPDALRRVPRPANSLLSLEHLRLPLRY